MDSQKRKTIPLKVKLPNLESLRVLSNDLTTNTRNSLIHKFGNILDFLYTNVQPDAITALAQFYDPPLRSFLFKDFQLAPTLEEFERLVEFPDKGKGPYVEIGRVPRLEDLAEALQIKVRDLSKNNKGKGGELGFYRRFLEENAIDLLKNRKMEAFRNVLALLIYGLVLFPSEDDFISSSAVSVFWAVLKDDRDPVPALLADVYYTLHTRHEKQKGVLLCCIPLLYSWLTSLLPGDYTQWNALRGDGWPQFLVSLTGNSVHWHSLKVDKDVIVSCGDFPNVPLIGSRACISYNPILTMRQLGRPMRDKPEESSLKSLILESPNVNEPTLLKQIVRAWGRIQTVNRLKRNNGTNVENYHQWVQKRAQEVKLPFIIKTSTIPLAPAPTSISMEEAEKLKKIIADLKDDKKELSDSLLKALQDQSLLERDLKEKNQDLNDLKDELASMEVSKIHFEEALFGANCELQRRNEVIKTLERKMAETKDDSLKIARLEFQIEEDRSYAKRKFEAQKAKFLEKSEELQKVLDEEREKLATVANDYLDSLQLIRDEYDRKLARSDFSFNQERERVEELKTNLAQEQAKGRELEFDLRRIQEWAEYYQQESIQHKKSLENLAQETHKGSYYRFLHGKNVELRKEIEMLKEQHHRVVNLGLSFIHQFYAKVNEGTRWERAWRTPEGIQDFLDYCFETARQFRKTLRGAI